ncbi:AsmA family protein, partial [Pseudomonas aeruginosa]
ATPPAADGKGAQAQAPEQAPQNDSPRTPIKLDIDSLNVNNARVTYTDEASGKQYNVEGIELSTGAIREGSSIPLKLNAYLGTNQPVVRVKTELTGNLRFDTALRRYQLEDARLSGEASGEPLQGKTATFSAQGQLLLDQSA